MISNKSILGLGGVLVLTAAAAHVSPSWTAKLLPIGSSSVSGTATVTATTPDSATASVSITGAKAGQYPWHVHTGKCGDKGAPIGNPAAYAPLTASASGQATAQATIAFKPAAGAAYSVNVHKSMTDMTPIACGDLSTGMGMSDQLQPVKPDTMMKGDTTKPYKP
jgi:hypothetical protein